MFLKNKSTNVKIAFILLFLLIFSTSCRLIKPDKEYQDYKGTAWAETNDNNYQIIGMHQDGAMVGIKHGNNGRVSEAVFFKDENSPGFYIWVGEDGLPYRAHIDGYLVLFNNFTENTVDMGVISPTGEVQIYREVVVDFAVSPSEVSYLNLSKYSTHNGINLSSYSSWKWSEVLKMAGHALSIGGCAASIIIPNPITPLTLAACGSALVGVMLDVLEVDNEYIKFSSRAFGVTVGAAGCVNPAGCITFALGLALDAGAEVAAAVEEHNETIQLVEATLEHGYGDVQVTLTWNNTADLDLWVTDPYGETIYYGNPYSASGGQLDVDDRDGFGPENIYWPPGGAPQGNYTVRVDYYSGSGTAYFKVLIQINGLTRVYANYISENQTITVASFINSLFSRGMPVLKISTVISHGTKTAK